MVACIRNYLYRVGVFPKVKVDALVISIGNIVAGGTGKTPLTLFLAKAFSSFPVAILTRGYGGDEEKILAKAAKVYVGKKREVLAQKAIEEGFSILLLDDGFQYRKLDRDIDILLLKNEKIQGRGRFLPWGYLRDSLSRIREADFSFIQEVDFFLKISQIVDLGGRRVHLEKKEKVAIFCAIANPSSFKNTVESLEVEIGLELILADHEPIDIQSWDRFQKKAFLLGCQKILVTEKDAVKFDRSAMQGLERVVVIEIEPFFQKKGSEKIKKLLDRVDLSLRSREKIW